MVNQSPFSRSRAVNRTYHIELDELAGSETAPHGYLQSDQGGPEHETVDEVEENSREVSQRTTDSTKAMEEARRATRAVTRIESIRNN